MPYQVASLELKHLLDLLKGQLSNGMLVAFPGYVLQDFVMFEACLLVAVRGKAELLQCFQVVLLRDLLERIDALHKRGQVLNKVHVEVLPTFCMAITVPSLNSLR